jgi:hypothetical protein
MRRELLVAETLQQRTRLRRGVASTREPAARQLVPEEDVLGDGEVVDDIELLVHRRDAEVDGGLRVADRDHLAVPAHLSGIGLVDSGQRLDQGGLTGAVLAQQAVHLSCADLQVHSTERTDGAESLLDPAHLQQGRRRHRRLR